MTRNLFFTGCCNRAVPYFATANGKGLAAFFLDEGTGTCMPAVVTGGIDNPTYATVSGDGRQLFASSEMFEWNEGTVSAHDIDATTGALTHASAVILPPGSGPRHVELHPDRDIAYVVNELNATVATITLDMANATGTCAHVARTVPKGTQDSDLVCFFTRAEGGSLTPLGDGVKTGPPTCVAIIPAP